MSREKLVGANLKCINLCNQNVRWNEADNFLTFKRERTLHQIDEYKFVLLWLLLVHAYLVLNPKYMLEVDLLGWLRNWKLCNFTECFIKNFKVWCSSECRYLNETRFVTAILRPKRKLYYIILSLSYLKMDSFTKSGIPDRKLNESIG